ncbi:MAG TPA: DUF5985 family protein [Bdellovibrionales bacterium]|nr:DUF5985 family protein [Bdellovibrionales bacterium]
MNGLSLMIFMNGITVATFAGAALFFLKFWKASRDPFFFMFSLACAMLSFERIALVVMSPTSKDPGGSAEFHFWIYMIRMLAFILIICAVVHRNRMTEKR